MKECQPLPNARNPRNDGSLYSRESVPAARAAAELTSVPCNAPPNCPAPPEMSAPCRLEEGPLLTTRRS